MKWISSYLVQAKKEFKQIEERCTAKAETLEDLRDMGGKSFRTTDLEKLMEKYDPEAYAQYSKFAKRADGARTHQATQTTYHEQMSQGFHQKHKSF